MLIKIEIVELLQFGEERIKETHYIETDSVNRALDMFDDDEFTDVRYHVMSAKEERKYYAGKLGSAGGKTGTPLQNKARAANAKHAGRKPGSKNKPKGNDAH